MNELLVKIYDKVEKIEDKLDAHCKNDLVIVERFRWFKIQLFAFWSILGSIALYFVKRFIDKL